MERQVGLLVAVPVADGLGGGGFVQPGAFVVLRDAGAAGQQQGGGREDRRPGAVAAHGSFPSHVPPKGDGLTLPEELNAFMFLAGVDIAAGGWVVGGVAGEGAGERDESTSG
ncbi:hypothetical protein [Kitasatospora griseola]|uniref:hypothetical protein n=1 Tax=Kitasatospora griseola TaxID=2064 RepID=UPI003827F79A